MLSCPYFVKKFVNSVKDYTILWAKNTLLSCPYLVQKTSILSKLQYNFDQKKSKGCLFLLFRFYEKNNCSHAPFWWINVNSLKKLLSCLYFVKKRLFSWNLVLTCHFSQLFSWKTPCSFPYLLKNINSVETTQYYGPKKSIGYHFFWFFKKKSQLQSHICQKKCPLS